MQRMIIKIYASFALMILMLVPAASVSAQSLPNLNFGASQAQQNACAGLEQLDAAQGCGKGDASINSIIKSVVSLLSYIVGIAAVIVVIVAGFKYITSAGDSGKVASAKSTLIYAIVGIIVAVSAQVIVKFAFSTASATACASNPKILASNASCKK